MESDDKVKWLEVRISSSLRPRNEDIKNMLLNDENRLAFHEFLNNEDVRRLFVYLRPPRQIVASLQPPHDLSYKSIFFLKANPGIKLNKDNMDEEVIYFDSSEDILKQLDIMSREVYLPLLCSDISHAPNYGISPDKLMDVLHRMMAVVEVTKGYVEGDITLSLPSIEVLAEAAASVNRRGAVLHVLETTVIGWIKQIKSILKHHPIEELYRQSGPYPGPLDEENLWSKRLDSLHSINAQLDSAVAQDILRNLEEANSTYASSFQIVRKDITKAILDTKENLRFLGTMSPWFHKLHQCNDPKDMVKLFAPLIHTMLLVWTHSKYYHQIDKYQNLLRLISNEVVHRAEAMVGEDVLREPLDSYTKLKEALRVCAAFRGTYLDYRDKALEINEKNKQEHAEKLITRPQGPYTLFSTKMYGPNAYTPRYGAQNSSADEEEQMREEELWKDSPWPPRNAPSFDLLNSFMERCNDVLELVQTTRHFRLLADTAEIGGAGTQSLDALVREIHQQYTEAMDEFFSQVSNVLAIDGSQTFEKAFFIFRTVVKDLERKLAEVLRQSFYQCPTIGSQLRLLEVFEGISSRELVQQHLKDKDRELVTAFTEELLQVSGLFKANEKHPPEHKNMPLVVSKMLWVYSLRQRIELPMNKFKVVSPHSLEGDLGWHLRDAFSETIRDLKQYETKVLTEWQNNITAELTERLKEPLMIAEEYDEDVEVRPQMVQVNLDPRLLLLLREIHYLSQDPFNTHLPAPARELLRNTNLASLRMLATRLETIVSKYNTVMHVMTEFEQPLFDRCLAKIDDLFHLGLTQYTWRTEESADFIETANALVCADLHHNLDIVQTNCAEVMEITQAWSQGILDIFAARDKDKSYDIQELVELQKKLNEEVESAVVPGGNRVHSLLEISFKAVHISEASPAWQDYVDYIDAVVLEGLKQACLVSLKSMLNQIVQCNMSEGEDVPVPILTIRLELIENQVAFRPPLDTSTSYTSVHETVQEWLEGFLDRGKLVPMLSNKGSYRDYISIDEETVHLIEHINRLVENNSEECKELYELFKDYAFLWQQDVNQTFEEFLNGNVSPTIGDTSAPISPSNLRAMASARSVTSRVSSAKSSIESAGLVGTAERSFLTPKTSRDMEPNVPSLDEFDAEIDIYRSARDEIQALQDHQDVGWLRVDLQPIKQVLTTYASKWMWTYTKYLSDQVTQMLQKLDEFLKRTEPEIESITGEERDTASFMKMMRLFNEVSAQQQEMDGKFAAMHRTVLLVKKYDQTLPSSTQALFDGAPGRWNSLKTKVSLAKQRLGPRIQEESDRITKDLATFSERVESLQRELDESNVYSRDCSIGDAWMIIDNFVRRLVVLENEAQDLIELQELLEASVVNFAILPACRHELDNLKQVWETVRIIDDQQVEWKRHRWQKMNTKFLREETNKQLDIIKALPDDVYTWDVYMGLHESITTIQECLPLIDDLSNPAMRTRHWKQLVRVTGGAVQIDNDTLKRMTLGELLSLGLQKHVDDVRAIVQRAVKDLIIEKSLKTYEEVWLSKIFELREHVRNKMLASSEKAATAEPVGDTQSEASESASHQQGTVASRSQNRTTSRVSNQSSQSRTRRTSVSSLPQSLLLIGDELSNILLLTNTSSIFDELEHHQVALQAMQSSSAAGSFLDEVIKWQKRLQTIEAVLTKWLEVQEKWAELEEVYGTQEIRNALSHDGNTFALVSRDFKMLMKATEKNPNVLQCCQRKNILTILEKMSWNLDICRKSLLIHLEKRRGKFPRFYFLSADDVLHLICNGYDLNQVNQYISKLFENVGSLIHEEVEDPERYQFQVTGVCSLLGERLLFRDPVPCEGLIEAWLPSLLTMLKSSLQHQLAVVMGTEKPDPASEKISAHSAKSPTDERRSALKSASKDKHSSQAGSHIGSARSRQEEGIPDQQGAAPASATGHSWMLDNATEVVYLATQINLTAQTSEALTKFDEGNKNSLQEATEKINKTIKATVIMLKGIEDEKDQEYKRVLHISEAQDKSDMLSETQSLGVQQRLTSQRESTLDVTILQHQQISQTEDSRVQTDNGEDVQSATGDQQTTTVALDPLVVRTRHPSSKPPEIEESIQESESTEMKLMLFPAQIQKISSLISLLAHQRELLSYLGQHHKDQSGPLAEDFLWKSQLQYSFTEDTKQVPIKIMEHQFDYEFEYLGSTYREVITPLTEKTYLSLTQAVKNHIGGLLVSAAGDGGLSSLQELSKCLGKPLYVFNCTSKLDPSLLYDIFKGYTATGSWISFNNINYVPAPVLSIMSQLLKMVRDAVQLGKSTVHILNEDITLHTDVACFATLDAAIKVEASNPEKLFLFNSAVSKLPQEFTAQFRTISLVKPDLKLMVEVLLLSQGFISAAELARKVIILYDMCRQLIGTNTPLVSETSHLTYNSMDLANGWSKQSLKYISLEAGAFLDQILHKRTQRQSTHRAHTAEYGSGEEEKQDRETPEKGSVISRLDDIRIDESEAVVTALRNTFMPRLKDRDASVFSQLIKDLWPEVNIQLSFVGQMSERSIQSDVDDMSVSQVGSKAGSRRKSHAQVMPARHKSYRDSLRLNTPVVQVASAMDNSIIQGLSDDKLALRDIDDAIAVATADLGLMPGVAFQGRVSQLAQLNIVHKTIIVCGPAGCGKSECIKTFALAERERGKTVDIQSVYTKTYESHQLLGYQDPTTKAWKDGLIPSLLRNFCVGDNKISYHPNSKPVMKVMQLDGEFDPQQFELVESMLTEEGCVVMANKEKLVMPDTLRFIWEIDSLASLSPSILGNVGILSMTKDDIGWAMLLAVWLEKHQAPDRELLKTLCDQYLATVIEYLGEVTKPPVFGKAETSGVFMKRMIYQPEEAMVVTFTTILDALMTLFPNLTDVEIERMFNYAAVWAFGGTIDVDHREIFSNWWKETFEQYIDYPDDGTVFDYVVDNESHAFVKWTDIIPAYSGTPHQGLPADAFVHCASNEQLLHLVGLLTDYGKPVMLVGEDGCGKSAIVSERVRTVCSGEVAEVLGLTMQANRFTNAGLLYQRLDELLEWKHGKTYVPKGNKRLLCFIDDVNLAQTDRFHNQTAIELIRQHIDDGGFYNPEDHSWRYVKNVTYISTVNPRPSANVPKLSPRLLRHFAVFGCPYPSHNEQHTIFSTLLHTHFITPELSVVDRNPVHHLGIQDDKVQFEIREEEAALKSLLSLIVQVTLELQDKLRLMFLPTAERCHYIFTMRDISNIFRNLCLSLAPACNRDNVLLLWEHECYWMYGHRMINEVDYDRFRQAFIRLIRKDFPSEEHIHLLSNRVKPVFSNLIEQDSGMVTAGNVLGNQGSGSTEEKTDLYKPVYNVAEVKTLMEHGVEEYNKTHPRIKLALYRTVIEQVCRLARVISSPHEVANCVLVSEGCPGRTPIIVNLASHLCGFNVFKISSSPRGASTEYKLDLFKADIVSAYTRAGVKGEKVLFLLEDDELSEEDFIVFLSEFIVSGSISHLFSQEEQTTIINSIRTEVTQAGLSYTRDVAWEFFLRTVKKNFRVCFICSEVDTNFQRRCREYPSFTKNVNFLWFGHWTKRELIHHAAFHLRGIQWMTRVQKENVAHMLATMHLVIRQQDGNEQGSGQYRHLTNLTYEKFVERFISMVCKRHEEIEDTHQTMIQMMAQIQRENALASKLKRELEHEKIVLSERKEGTIKILAQIGQDTAITEQQIKIVKAQMDKIHRLKKLLPEYQVAHERAVYKTVSIVADTKKIVQTIDLDSLSELRAMQKPIIDIEDLMAAIIMILKKNPQADLTWQKGAKRQMANLERFIEELLTFDEEVLPESTLVLVEPYLKKPTFDPESLERKTNNSACASLCKWVKGVCRYHRMMISKVKPLHSKVEETTAAIDNAEHRMNILDNKRKALEVRLADLAKGFEEATIDKNEQEEKTNRMDKKLETAARLKKVLQREQSRIQQVIDSLPHRKLSVFGGVAMAAGLTTYLGPYHHSIRRIMLTIHWPNCLRERGIPLVIDSIDELKGRVVDWTIDQLNTADGASGVGLSLGSLRDDISLNDRNNQDELMAIKEEEEEEEETEQEQIEQEIEGEEKQEVSSSPAVNEEKQDDGSEKKSCQSRSKHEEEEDADDMDKYTGDGETRQDYSHTMDGDQYSIYMRSLIKLIVGEDVLHDWLRKDFGNRQMENAAILYSSWQRPPMLIDPYGEGVSFLQWLNKKLSRKRLIVLDMDGRCDPQVIMAIEKAITKGLPLLLENCDQHIDSLITPIIQHRNTALENTEEEEPRMIKYCGRRILCYPDFRLYLATNHPKPVFTPSVASSTTLINFGSSNDTIGEELLMRAFARVCPELYKERRLALKNIHINSEALNQLWQHFKNQVYHTAGVKHMLFNEKDVDAVADMTQKTVLISQRLEDAQQVLDELDRLRDVLEPLARRAMRLYAILRSLSCIRREYQFTLTYFIKLFDEAIQGEFPPEYTNDSDDDEDYMDDETASMTADKRAASAASGNDEARANEEQKNEVEDATSRHGSTTDGAAGTEVKDDSDEKLQLFELPEVAPLPSEGVEYNSLPDNKIKQMIDSVTSLVFQHTRKSLNVEDRLLFAALLCLTIQAEGDHFTEEEVSLLLQGNPGLGMQLSLADFDYKGEPPSWLPTEKWEDIMAISVLPGPLDSLCVHLARESEAWKAWYHCQKPETEPVPLSKDSKQDASGDDDRQNQSTTPDLGPLSEFHLLLLLRLLRPDRLPTAMTTYVTKHLNLNLDSQSEFGIEQLMDSVANQHVGVLVLLPPSPSQTDTHALSSVSMTSSPTENIKNIGQSRGVTVQVVTVGEGLDGMIFEAVETAEYNNSWLVVENLHHASDKFFTNLRELLQRIVRRRETKNAKFCVWFTSEPCPRIPMDMLLLLHKLAWDALDSTANEDSNKREDQAEHQSNTELMLESGSLESILRKAIISVFCSVPTDIWEKTSGLPQNMKCMIYAFGVTQGLFIARQMFGARGLSQFYNFDASVYIQAIENLVSMVKATKDGDFNITEMTDLFSKIIYGQAVCNPWDKDYVITASSYIISSVTSCQSDTVKIGVLDLPIPPVNVEPTEYCSWFADKTSEGFSTIAGLSLHGNVDREANDAHAVHFITMMDHLYQAQNLTLGEVEPVIRKHSMNMLRLRAILDNIVEALPPLLELGKVPDDLIKAEYDFPYHQPSVISLATAESVLMPESLGFVLLQECLWHNSLLCHIHQSVHEIHRCLLSGPQSFPHELIETANSIMEEYVPTSWVHPNCQPCTHSITSWLTDLNKRHIQMQGWVKRRMVPVFKEGSQTPESHGTLRSVWLGGLVNPQALMVALRQEKAVMAGCQYDEVDLVVDVCELPPDVYNPEDDGISLHLTDLYMQGAMWDLDTNQLVESSHDLNSLPGLRVWPELVTNIKEATRYHCPLFMNRARQVCPFHLDIDCPEPVNKWMLSGTAIILDIGIPPDAAKKSRAFMMPKQTLSSARSDNSSQGEEEPEEEHEEEYDFGDDQPEQQQSVQETDRSEDSIQSQSQLSYKPMSPQAPPLPPDLQLTREPLMIDEQESKHSSPQSKKQPEKSSDRLSRPPSNEPSKELQRTPSNQSVSRASERSHRSEAAASQRSISHRSDRSATSGVSSRHSSQTLQKSDRGLVRSPASEKPEGSTRSQPSSQQENLTVERPSDKGRESYRTQSSEKLPDSDKSDLAEGRGSVTEERESNHDRKEHDFGTRMSVERKSSHHSEVESAIHSPSHSQIAVPSEPGDVGSRTSPQHDGMSIHEEQPEEAAGQRADGGSASSIKHDDASVDEPEPGQDPYSQEEDASTTRPHSGSNKQGHPSQD